MKTIIKKLLAHYWLVYPVLILKMFIYFYFVYLRHFLLKKVNPDDMDFILYTH